MGIIASLFWKKLDDQDIRKLRDIERHLTNIAEYCFAQEDYSSNVFSN